MYACSTTLRVLTYLPVIFTVTEVFVDSAGSAVCLNVSLRNDATVNEAIARTIFLTLGSDNDLVFAGPPAIITVLDDDG